MTKKTTQIDSSKLTLKPFPASQKIYIESANHSDVKVAMRNIKLSEKSDLKNFTVYDTSGIYSDEKFLDKIDLNKGLPRLRESWIKGRDDVENYLGRSIKPQDNGLVNTDISKVPSFDTAKLKPLKAKPVKHQRNWPMLELELLPKKWNMWQFVKI